MGVTGFLPVNEVKREFRCRLPIAWREYWKRINRSTESVVFCREPFGGKLHFAAWREEPAHRLATNHRAYSPAALVLRFIENGGPLGAGIAGEPASRQLCVRNLFRILS